MTEVPVVFGGATALSGIVTAPGAGAGASARTGVVFLSAGVRHRVGPNRLHVTIARALAAAGLPSLRFDLSGIGESGSRSDDLSYEASVREDARLAMDLLAERHGVSRFILYGLCSGADNAIRVAVADPRVVGAVLLQAYSFSSRGYALEKNVRALLKPANWRRLFEGRLGARAIAGELRRVVRRPRRTPAPSASASSPTTDDSQAESSWQMPSAQRIVEDLRVLGARGARLFLVYSAGSQSEYNYRAIMRAEARRLGGRLVRVETFRRSDHNITPLGHQQRLVEMVVEWARDVDRG